jgi:hypothetical protein
MLENLDVDELTTEQADVLDDAALLVFHARKGARAMLARAGIPVDDSDNDDDPLGWGSCTGRFDGERCPCSSYRGPGPCNTKIAPPGIPLPDSTARCGHRAGMHLFL